MGKADTTNARDKATQYQNQTNSDVHNLMGSIRGQQDVASGRASEDYAPTFSGYSDFATTGGMSDADKNAFLRSATSGVRGTYDVLARQLARSRARTGGLGGGGETAELARHAGQDVATTNTGANVALRNLINQGKLSGLGGLSGLYGTNLNASQNYNDQLLKALGINVESQGNAEKVFTSLSKNPSMASRLGEWGNLIGGSLQGAFGGG